MSSVRVIAAMCLAHVLSMAGFSTYPALLPTLQSEWALTNTEAGWVASVFFVGYVAAVALLTSLTDRIDARRVYLASLVVSALALIGFAAFVDGFWSAILWRTLAGIGLAGSYMPGMKALTDRIGTHAQSRAVAFYTAHFAIGVSVSFALSGPLDAWLGWRGAFALSAAGPALALLPAIAVLRPCPPDPAAKPPTHILDFRPVLRARAAMAYVLAYTGHSWELFAMRAWVVAFFVFSQEIGPEWGVLDATALAALIGLVGLPASVIGNELAVRFGRRRMVIGIMLLSFAMSCTVGFSAALPLAAVAALCLVYNALVTADSAAITAGAIAAAPAGYRGATMAVHSLIGFSGGVVGPLAVGLVLDMAGGGASLVAWGLGFATMGAGVALGAAALWLVHPRPAAVPAANGRA